MFLLLEELLKILSFSCTEMSGRGWNKMLPMKTFRRLLQLWAESKRLFFHRSPGLCFVFSTSLMETLLMLLTSAAAGWLMVQSRGGMHLLGPAPSTSLLHLVQLGYSWKWEILVNLWYAAAALADAHLWCLDVLFFMSPFTAFNQNRTFENP